MGETKAYTVSIGYIVERFYRTTSFSGISTGQPEHSFHSHPAAALRQMLLEPFLFSIQLLLLSQQLPTTIEYRQNTRYF